MIFVKSLFDCGHKGKKYNNKEKIVGEKLFYDNFCKEKFGKFTNNHYRPTMKVNVNSKVEKEFCEDYVFRTNYYFSIPISQQALSEYSKNLNAALNLDNNIPIFLDTNVLLDYYKISFTERDDIIKFFEKNKSRIYITKQIESEFLKHRIDHIRSYLISVDEFINAYKNIKTEVIEIKSGTIRGFEHFTKKNQILVNDHPELCLELSKLNEEISNSLVKIFSESDFEQRIFDKETQINEIQKKLEGKADIERDDPLLEIVTQFNIVDNLTQKEVEFLKKQFDILRLEYEKVKGEQNLFWKYTFPGCGDKKEDPYGDFIIYHEITKFQYTSEKDAIFLTNDTTKNDWLLRNKYDLKPYTHYIINSFSLSNQTLYILNAKDKIRISYDPIYTGADETSELKEQDTSIGNDNNQIKKSQLKILDFTVDLDRYKEKSFNYYNDITKEEFLNELRESEKWADKYGSGFVGTNSFVMKYLGAKGYHYRHSYDVKDELVENGLIVEYQHKPKNPEFNPVDALKVAKR